MKIRILLFVLLIVFFVSGSVQDRAFEIKGFVRDELGQGVSGVVVNDGRNFTVTDEEGAWRLTSDTAICKYVSISTPADFELPQTNGVADGYYKRITKEMRKQENVFVIKRRTRKSDKFRYIAISDPQVLNEHDMLRWENETVVDVMATIAKANKIGNGRKSAAADIIETVGVTLGDLVFDSQELYSQYKTSVENMGMTIFQCIGNHDFDKRYADLQNMPVGTPVYAEQMYEEYFGPVNYSFNIGKVHVITIKNINYHGNKKYEERVTPDVLMWLENDLSYVPKGSLVFLNMHAPAWNDMEKVNNVENENDLEDVLKGYNVHIFCGHTHFYENVEVDNELYQHNIGAACGAWWIGDMNRCGASNGYMIVDVNGKNVKWNYKGTGKPADYKMKVYNVGEFTDEEKCVVANIWDWDSSCKIEWYQNGLYMGKMDSFKGVDSDVVKMLPRKGQRVATRHLFRAKAQRGSKVRIVYTDHFGKTYSKELNVGFEVFKR